MLMSVQSEPSTPTSFEWMIYWILLPLPLWSMSNGSPVAGSCMTTGAGATVRLSSCRCRHCTKVGLGGKVEGGCVTVLDRRVCAVYPRYHMY